MIAGSYTAQTYTGNTTPSYGTAGPTTYAITGAFSGSASATSVITDADSQGAALSGLSTATAALLDSTTVVAPVYGFGTLTGALTLVTEAVTAASTSASTVTATTLDKENETATVTATSVFTASLGPVVHPIVSTVTGFGYMGRSNLVANPSFETDLSGWAAYVISTISRVAGGYVGGYSLMGVSAGVTNGGGTAGITNYHFTGLVVGQTYTASAYVRGDAIGGIGSGNFYVSAGSANINTYYTLTTSWQRVSVSFTVIDATSGDIYVRTSDLNANMYVDGVQLEAGAIATPYFDGNTPGAVWNGPTNSSASQSNNVSSTNTVPMTATITGTSSLVGGAFGTYIIAASVSGQGSLRGGVGNSLLFNGSSTTVLVNSPASALQSNVAKTVSAWIKPGSSLSDAKFLAFRGLFTLGITTNTSTGSVRFEYGGAGGYRDANFTIAVNAWTHVVMTYDGSGAVKGYLNGGIASSFTITPANISALGTQPSIGNDNGNGRWFLGNIDDVNIWNGLFTDNDVAALYATGIPKSGATLAGSWLFDEGMGTTATDTSGNGTPGTLTGFTFDGTTNGYGAGIVPTPAVTAVDTISLSATMVGVGTLGRQNLVTNPSFEVDLTSWLNYNGTTTTTRDTSNNKFGFASLKVISNGGELSPADGGSEYNLGALPMGTYTFSGYIKTDANVTNACLLVRSTMTYGVVAGTPKAGVTLGTANLNWVRVSDTFDANGTDTYSILAGLGSYGTASAGTAYFDGILLERSSTLNSYTDSGTISISEVEPMTADVYGYGTIGKENIIPNPSFETDLTGWSSYQNATLSRTTAEAYIGTASMKVVTDGSGTGAYGYQQGANILAVSTVPGVTCTTSMYIKGPVGKRVRVYQTYGTDGQDHSTEYVIGASGWVRYTDTYAPGSAHSFMFFMGEDVAGSPQTYYVDAVLSETAPVPSPYFEGRTNTLSDATTLAAAVTATATISAAILDVENDLAVMGGTSSVPAVTMKVIVVLTAAISGASTVTAPINNNIANNAIFGGTSALGALLGETEIDNGTFSGYSTIMVLFSVFTPAPVVPATRPLTLRQYPEGVVVLGQRGR